MSEPSTEDLSACLSVAAKLENGAPEARPRSPAHGTHFPRE
ncbi:hypothetical protein GcM1_163010 [Golovinomyces cichoracearum]|uniref:Uncharacterized protein n=1 Tax=Golovinomyces cichoracearum TaxID=62708 RepID=A0A420J8J7_9PEZI|nr:hypothetical protein GcM1_163010 [Golovinomyces cichoracearum]